MKVKKDLSKIKKKKNKIESVTTSSGIKKFKKKKVKKIENNREVAEVIKKECAESQKDASSRIPIRQKTWNQYLKVFFETEKLNKKQKQIMEFCTNKSLTPPRRKQKFLNFIRNCFEHQKDFTDEQINELFDLVLKKYVDYKSGTYVKSKISELSSDVNKSTPGKPSKNKKRKLNRVANDKQKSISPVKSDEDSEKQGKAKVKKRKQKVTNLSVDDGDVEMVV